ncbi:hypothetical protein QQ045_018435 [Rhodiola kirilowii]
MAARGIILFFFSLIFFNLFGASISIENCTTTPACNSSAPFLVSFPFRIPQYQPNNRCGYSSGFNLRCANTYKQKTLLYISNSGYFSIDTIDYLGQTITVRDPNRCFPQRFLNMDLSSSPFSFYYPYQYTYYNCTRSAISGYESNEATCMSDTQYSIIVLLSEGDSDRDVIRDNCTVIKSFVVAPSTLHLYPYWSNMASELYWSEPRAPPIEQANLNPIFLLGKGDVLLEPNVAPCAICLCEYKLGDILRTISDSNHSFHFDCVDEWLRTKSTCPVCRKDA